MTDEEKKPEVEAQVPEPGVFAIMIDKTKVITRGTFYKVPLNSKGDEAKAVGFAQLFADMSTQMVIGQGYMVELDDHVTTGNDTQIGLHKKHSITYRLTPIENATEIESPPATQ